jgi:hypothetical protein
MLLPSNLSIQSQEFLAENSFKLVESNDHGMCKYYLWSNTEMQFSLTYDRGYYDCSILTIKVPFERMDIIRLLRFLKNDKTYYRKELIEANLLYTLTTNEYVELLYKNYNLIKVFLNDFNQEKYDNYNKFEFSYDGLPN